MALLYTGTLQGTAPDLAVPAISQGQINALRHTIADTSWVCNSLQSALQEVSPGATVAAVFADSEVRRKSFGPGISDPD